MKPEAAVQPEATVQRSVNTHRTRGHRCAASRRMLDRLALALVLCAAPCVHAQDVAYCGDEGVWIQILGSGGAGLSDQRSAATYLLWIDERARILIGAGSGAALRFDQTGANIEDLDAVLLNHLRPHATADLPSLLEGAIGQGRDRPLPLFGPSDGGANSTSKFVERLIGSEGAYPQLAGFLTPQGRRPAEPGDPPDAGDAPDGNANDDGDVAAASMARLEFWLSVRDVLAVGRRPWAEYRAGGIRYSAIPVYHGGTPALAWRLDIGDRVVVFTGDFNNQKDMVAGFAEGADVLVAPNAILEESRGALRDRFVIPSQLGRIASRAEVSTMILGHRSSRTLGWEFASRRAIREHYEGNLIFAEDLECWGL